MMNFSEQLCDLATELCVSLFVERVLCPDTGVFIRRADIDDLSSMKDLYAEAFGRGDWYGSRTSATDGVTASVDYLQHYLQDEKAIVVLFHDANDNVLGSTLLDLSTDDGVLIDDTQIHPVLGRRKGIMSAYFRRLVPELNRIGCPYWTEFVLTPESRVLRRVLITELGMRVTGIRPAAYFIRPMNERRSVVVAHGPNVTVTKWLDSLLLSNDQLADLTDLIASLTRSDFNPSNESRTTRDRWKEFQEYGEYQIDLTDEHGISEAISRGGTPVGLKPVVNQVYVAHWPKFDLSALDFLHEEHIPNVNNLLTYIKNSTAPSHV